MENDNENASAVPKYVLLNNRCRACVIDCANPAGSVAGWLRDNLKENEKAVGEFMRTHQSTCAIYEAIVIAKDLSVANDVAIMCPYCRQEMSILCD